MKSILISIKPKYVVKILNGEKTIEIRKTMPECDLPIDVYIYCTKDKKYANLINRGGFLTGMVVAKFTLNKVEDIELNKNHFVNEQYSTDELNYEELLEKSCLTYRELDNYLQCEVGYAWHIDNLVIFDKPKELSEFYKVGHYEDLDDCFTDEKQINGKWCIPLTKAPMSYCYVEVE